MLFWLFVIVLAIGVAAIILGSWMYNHTNYDTDWLQIIGITIVVVMSIAILVSGILILDNYCNADARVASNKEIYKSLTYQLKNNMYDNDNELGKKELYNQIQEWNKDVVYYQNIQDNFWFGIYYPNVYDQFETIDYEAYN